MKSCILLCTPSFAISGLLSAEEASISASAVPQLRDVEEGPYPCRHGRVRLPDSVTAPK